MGQARIRIMVVDDHPIVLKGVSAALCAEPDMEIVATVMNGKAALDAFRRDRPDVTLMDLGLTKEMTGVQAIKAIRSEFPQARIIVFSALNKEEDIFRALQAGAATYLLKDMLSEQLAPFIRQVHAGGRPVPSEVGAKLAEHAGQVALTAREIEVLQLVAKGMSNPEIGETLHLSSETVAGHLKNARMKLNVSDRTGMVMAALRRGILRLD